jgi:hypothetical protein
MYIFSMIGVSSSMGPNKTQGNTLEVEGKLLEFEMASHDLSTTTLISLGVSLISSRWRHSSSCIVDSLISHIVELLISHIVESLISHIVESLISHIVESLISMAMTSSMSEQPSKEEDNTRGVEVKLLEIKVSSLNSCGVSLLISRCLK